jgi:hypothetical protein
VPIVSGGAKTRQFDGVISQPLGKRQRDVLRAVWPMVRCEGQTREKGARKEEKCQYASCGVDCRASERVQEK